MPITPRAVVFDFDGTLYDLAVDWHGLRTDLVALFADLGSRFTGHTLYVALDAACEHAGTSLGRTSAVQLRNRALSIIQAYEVAGAQKGKPRRQARTTLRWLADQGVQIGIVSSNSRQAVRLAIQQPCWPSCYVVAREDVARMKPDPEGVIKCLTALDVHPSDAWGVGNDRRDYQAFVHAGLARAMTLGAIESRQPSTHLQSLAELTDRIGL